MIDTSQVPTIENAAYIDLTKVDGEVEGFGKDEKLLLVCTKGRRAYLLPVSYTHLDVYKRQMIHLTIIL